MCKNFIGIEHFLPNTKFHFGFSSPLLFWIIAEHLNKARIIDPETKIKIPGLGITQPSIMSHKPGSVVE